MEEENRRLIEQIAHLQNQATNNQDDLPAAQAAGDSARESWKRRAASAGRRTAVMHMPFMDPNYLFDHRVQVALPGLIEDVQKVVAVDDPEEDAEDLLDDDQNPQKYWEYYHFGIADSVDVVREVLYRMPPQAGDRWFKVWFKNSVSHFVNFINSMPTSR